MGRKPREKSSTGIYHVVIRGADRQIMFEEERDYQKYLELLMLYKEECSFQIYAYCLMSNHVHLLIYTPEDEMEFIFRKLNTSYAMWFNMKYQRTGSLQQGRYYSEPITDERYLTTVLRYIHQNPMKAGLEEYPGKKYRWCSYMEYIQKKDNLVDTVYMNNMIGGIEKYQELHMVKMDDDENILDVDHMVRKLPDDVARQIIEDECNCRTVIDFQNLSLETRNKYLVILHKRGLSVRQLNRLTGIPRGIITKKISQKLRP